MLQYLSIHNYILIQDIHVTLSDRFNVFTGETGAGKSMLVDALNFVTGQRSGAHIVGRFSETARVEAAFALPLDHPIYKNLEAIGFAVDPDDSLIVISREMNQDGRNVCRINHRVVNVSTLRELFEKVVDIHSQHETQYLRDWKQHIQLLDAYSNTASKQERYTEHYKAYQKALKELKAFQESEINPDAVANAEKELKIINALIPSQEDYDTLIKETDEMNAFESRNQTYQAINAMFDENPPVMERLYSGLQLFDDLNNESLNQQFKDVYYELEDIRGSLQDHQSALNFDPFEYDRMQGRIHEYQQLFRKYGDVSGILNAQEDLMKLIDRAQNYDDYLTDHQNEVARSYEAVMDSGLQLRKVRETGAKRLEKAIVGELKDLMLENAVFEVFFSEKEPASDGIDTIQFYVSMNKSEKPQALDKVASGGELSRLMLGLKVIFSKIYGITTIIFDEIDTGVSGPVGIQIGAKMKVLSKSAQVIAISHLSSVAACADHHYLISKAQDDNQTVTDITEIVGNTRIEQLALIMSGSTSEAAMRAAQELYHEGQAI